MGPKRILIVEDDASITEILTGLLADEGYEVDAAEDGVAGLDALRDSRPDLVLVDVMMPRMGGLELLRTLRSGLLADLPAVLMSAARPPDYHGLGVAAFVAKPFDVDEMIATVARIIGPPLAEAV